MGQQQRQVVAKRFPCEPEETNLGEDDLHDQEGTGYQCSDLKK